MAKLRTLAGHTVIYGVSGILGRLLNYLLVPLYTAVFVDTAEYGIITELYAYVAFLNVIYAYGFETTFFRFATNNEDGTGYFNVAQTSLLISSILFSAILILLATPISHLINYPGKEDFIIWLAIVIAIDAIVVIPFARLRLEGKGFRFATFRITNILINLGLNLFFILFCPWMLNNHPDAILTNWIETIYSPELGVGYVFLSNLIANAFYLVFFLPDLLRVKLVIDSRWIKMFNYAFPLLIIGLAGVTIDMLSRTMLKYYLPEGFYPGLTSQQALGIFGACYKLSVFMTIAVQAFRYAFEPFFFNESSNKESPEMLSKVMNYFIIFGAFSWLGISLLLPVIGPIFLQSPNYLKGLNVVPWLLGGGLFLGIYYNLSVWYKLTDKTKYGAYINILGAVMTIGLNFWLIPIMGYMGSAVATFVVYGTMVVISYLYGKNHYPVPYKVGKGLIYLGLAGGLIIGVYFWDGETIYRYIYVLSALIGFVLFAWFYDIKRLINTSRP
ncbi:MAG: polysaccharide biosynthesis C-terminal domain-containing protein [Bacteroidota bacterium]